MKILIIEDNLVQAKLIKKIVFKIKDTEPILAKDALEGYAILRAIPEIRLIILDYKMPYINGIEFLKKIRSTPLFESLVVLISSAEDLFDEYIQAGADKVLIKPYNLIELNDFIIAVKNRET
jgi:DNA-binding response OmpR family regulator